MDPFVFERFGIRVMQGGEFVRQYYDKNERTYREAVLVGLLLAPAILGLIITAQEKKS